MLRWVAKRVDELVEEEMGSGTQVDQDDFKVAVEQFNDRVKTVKKELDKQVKTKQAQTAELFEAARVQSAMVFGLDDEPIPGVDATADSPHATTSGKSSIALNQVACAAANKRKREDNQGPSSDAMLLADSFKESTAVLARALVGRSQTDSATASKPTVGAIAAQELEAIATAALNQ